MQLEALQLIGKLIETGAIAMCENFIKPLICEVFLNPQGINHRNVKIQCFKLIELLVDHYDIVQILVAEDEP